MEKISDEELCRDCGIPYESYKRVKEKIKNLECRGDILDVAERHYKSRFQNNTQDKNEEKSHNSK